MNLKILSVSKLNNYIKNIFNNDVILSNVTVQGELSNVKMHSSGHLYFSLKDHNSLITCIMFKSNASLVDFTPMEGNEVIAKGYVNLYEKTGQYQLYVQQIKIHGEGNLYLKFERLKKELKEKGWFDPAFKRPIPSFPKTVAVVTSETGAALQDIISVLRRRNPSIIIYLYPVLVQGDRAKYEISKAIDHANHKKCADVIILGRGGGSIEELWAFNEEIVARSVYYSQIPIITAIGHETDFTIADFVADYRAPTPSAAAEVASISVVELADKLIMQKNRLKREMLGIIETHQKRLGDIKSNHLIKRPFELVNQYRQHLDYMDNTLKSIILKTIQEQRVRLLNDKNSFNNMIAKQGLGKLFNSHGDQIVSIKSVHEGEKIDILLPDGRIKTKIIEIIEGE